MQTNPESAAVEAVAMVCLVPSKRYPHFAGVEIQLYGGYEPVIGDKLVPQSALDALRGEVETCRRLLSEKVSAETMLRELHITPAGLSAQVEGGMAGILMQSIVDQFREIGGPNFFEMKFIADQQQYVLTVQRSAGLTPADKMKAAEQRADAAERRVAELEALLRAWHAEESRYGVRSQAPGHSHQVPGVWDSDNSPIAGTACAKCALWAQIREIARTESP